jgi:ABC-2 type transport system ATP-binding protein
MIEVTNLSKKYNNFQAVDNLSFTVNQGEIYGFLGQNGAGKSTTLRMLLSLIKPTSGEIEIFGKNISTHRLDILGRIGAVIERPDLYNYLTAMENIQLFSKLATKPIPKQQILDKLHLVGLLDRKDSKVKTFSQGMKQRLGIAVALVSEPDLVILDEPTNGLDPQGIADIRDLMRKLSKEEGKTIVVSSHLLSEIELIADRMLIIDKGKKLMEGDVSQLLDANKMLVKIQLSNKDSILPQLGHWRSYLSESSDSEFNFQIPRTQIPELNSFLVKAGAEIFSIRSQYSLEDYFFSLTNSSKDVDRI